MVIKELLKRHNRTISGESKPMLIKNAYEVILSIPVYRYSGASEFSVFTSNDEKKEWIELGRGSNYNSGLCFSLSRFSNFIKLCYDLGKDGECEFASYVIIKKTDPIPRGNER